MTGTPDIETMLSAENLLSQQGNKARLQEIARSTHIDLSGFHWDHDLELYFNIEARGMADCYIAKGWTDPGFRVAAIVSLPAGDWFDQNVLEYMWDNCGLEGVCLSRLNRSESADLSLESVIYSGGLNAESFVRTVDAVSQSAIRIRELVATSLFIPKGVALAC